MLIKPAEFIGGNVFGRPPVQAPRYNPRRNDRGMSGVGDPIVPIGVGGSSSYTPPMTGSATKNGVPCPDCPPNCTTTDEVVTMFVSPQQLSPDDKPVPVIRTGRVCEDNELDIDCDTSQAGPTMNGLYGLGNATDAPVPTSGDVLIATDAGAAADGGNNSNTLLLVGVVAAIATLATVALSSGGRRR